MISVKTERLQKALLVRLKDKGRSKPFFSDSQMTESLKYFIYTPKKSSIEIGFCLKLFGQGACN